MSRPALPSALALPIGLTLAAAAAIIPSPAVAADPAGAPPAGDVHALLAAADAFRLAPGATQVRTQVDLEIDGQLDKRRDYLVYVAPGRRSLVLFQTPSERGQKVLMLADDFWIVMPSSQRPIRITPAQKLLGDASTGDIATMTWAEDYGGAVAGEAEVEGVPCLKLDLAAQRRGVTYARIELYLAKADARPVQADLYVASDRLAKRATFEVGTVNGERRVQAMVLADQIQTHRRTVIRYLATAPRAIGEAYYNPMFLTHHDPE
jgi:hypothetical protein